MPASIRYGFWIVLQIGLGLLSTVVLYRVLYLTTWNVSGLPTQSNLTWLHSPFSDPLIHSIVLLFLGLAVCESILKIPVKVLEQNRWLVLFALVFLSGTTTLIHILFLFRDIHLSGWITIPYYLVSFGYLIRFQWRFIEEKTYYDLLLGPVYLWGFDQIAMEFIYGISFSDVQADDVGKLYALYVIPAFFILPGLFPKEKMKYAVIFSLLSIGLCYSVIYNPQIMGYLVDRPRYFLPLTYKVAATIGAYVFIHQLLFSMLGRFFYFGPGWAMRVWKNRKRLWKSVSSN